MSALDRLAALAATYDLTLEAALTRLLDADPHEHQHRCPTCARMDHRTSDATAETEPLFTFDPAYA